VAQSKNCPFRVNTEIVLTKCVKYFRQYWHLAGYVLTKKYGGIIGYILEFNRSINCTWKFLGCASIAFNERYNTAHAHCTLGNLGYTYTLEIFNNYCFSTAKMVKRTRLIITLYLHWLSCLLKPTGYVMHHQFNIQQLYALPTLYLCVLYLGYLRTNSDLCHLQYKLIGFYNRDEKCLQRGTDWVFK